MAELDRGGDAELGEARDVLRREQLRMLDARSEAEWLPHAARLLEGVECLAVGEVADRVHGDGESCGCAAADDLRQLLATGDLDTGAVEHASRLRSERPVHER